MKTLIGIPSCGNMKLKTVASLFNLKGEYNHTIWANSLVYVARTELAHKAVVEGYDYLLFIDDDMMFEPNILEKFIERDKDIVTALCFKRTGDFNPCIYSSIEPGSVEEITDFDDEFFQVEGCGMAACLIKTKVLKKLGVGCFYPMEGLGEDFSFCKRAKDAGFEIWCDTTVPVLHIGEKCYGKYDFVGTRQNIKSDICHNYCKYFGMRDMAEHCIDCKLGCL